MSAFEEKIIYNNYQGLPGKIGRTFPAFVEYVLERAKNNDCFNPNAKSNCHLDWHWRPFYTRCGYCDIEYDFIGTMETFDQDRAYIIQEKNLKELYPVLEEGIHLNKISHASNRTLNYFKELNWEQKERLRRLYDFDFQLFGYDPYQYM